MPDLFWALRGGGGNFAIVTEFTFQLHPVDQIYGGPMFFELSDGEAVLSYFNEFIQTAPSEYGGLPGFQIAPPLPFVPEDPVGEPFIVIVSCWTGSVADGEKILQRFRDVAHPAAEMVGPMPYSALNSAFDGLVPRGLQHYWKAAYAVTGRPVPPRRGGRRHHQPVHEVDLRDRTRVVLSAIVTSSRISCSADNVGGGSCGS